MKSATQTELLQNPCLSRRDITYCRREEDPDLARGVSAFLSSVPVFRHPGKISYAFFFFLIRLNFCGKLKPQRFNSPL